ncbi:EF-hand domain-containing protein [Brevundimonas sp. NIBR11]|uniref:EF-hand domain-containing protein n=1 Tax=Brevundimonas sp. NIBR11 TaxID=3015999 RepID=UPI0022F00BFC|nr:EF-hand domain-containing protein [Brevundimonas sp. NIBR11]WGM32122.1 hypothetical protein KKHFBJBL_02373 [Brevundimonas sp. NIBR11]
MKKTILAAGVAALAVLTAGSALAQQAPRGPRVDADRDGQVTRAEFVDARLARLTAIDANRDGSVSAEERQSGRDTRRNQRVSARFETLDKNGDGAISREEFTAPREARADGARQGRGHRMQGPRGHRGQWAGMRGHRGQGAQRGEAPAVSIADVRTRLTTRFDRVDTNRDGVISAEERTAARQAMREQRGERRAERMAHRAARQASPSAPASE